MSGRAFHYLYGITTFYLLMRLWKIDARLLYLVEWVDRFECTTTLSKGETPSGENS